LQVERSFKPVREKWTRGMKKCWSLQTILAFEVGWFVVEKPTERGVG
jgi:hypothetical protein